MTESKAIVSVSPGPITLHDIYTLYILYANSCGGLLKNIFILKIAPLNAPVRLLDTSVKK